MSQEQIEAKIKAAAERFMPCWDEEDAEWLRSAFHSLLTEVRTNDVAKLETIKVRRTPVSAAESACAKCGFNKDHQQCYCAYNEGVDAAKAALQAKD